MTEAARDEGPEEGASESKGEGETHPLVGQIIGERYRIDALLGEGGMGAVFRATHLGLGRPVAVKMLHPRLSADDHVAKRFDREALAVSKLDHPNCVQVLDFGTTRKGMKYLVMQLLEGKELRDLTGVALPVEQVVYLGLQVFRALEHAHKRGLVHRDLKPENIFLVEDDDGNQVLKLVDFGIVKLLEDAPAEKLTRMGMAFGTPTYMSPEQAAGGKIDARTDLYAVGVVLYELLTGVPPFDADEPGILLRMQILADPPPLPDTVPKSVIAVVEKLLAKEPGDRYADAREARRALSAAYALPSKVSGMVSPAALAQDDPTEPPVMESPAASSPALMQEQAPEQSPTPAQSLAETRAEPLPSESAELFASSGGTVLAPPTSPPAMAMRMTGGGAAAGQAAMPGHAASSSHGSMPSYSPASSYGSVPIVPLGHGGSHYDPLAVSSPGLPVMGPGVHGSGVHPRSGIYAAPAGTQRGAGRRTGTIVLAVVLLIWVFIGLVWWGSRDDGQPAPSGASPAPAAAPAAGGLYRFADEDAPAKGASAAEAKKPSKKIKKPKQDDDD